MSDLSAFRISANQMRSGEARTFDGEFVTCNGETGEWRAGKAKTDIDGRRLIADVYDLILGWQRYKDKKFIYAGHGFVRDKHQPPQRERLDDRNPSRWQQSDNDPWQLTYYLGMFDQETREQFIFTTNSSGGKDALAILQDVFADHNEGRAPDAYEWPVVELSSDSYINSYGKRIFKPILDVVGWCEPPAAFRLPKPPASTATLRAIEHKPDNGKTSKASSSDDEMDDEIPF